MRSSLRSLFVATAGADLKPVLAALARGGFEPWWDWDRVGTERELVAALELGTYDVLIYDVGSTIPADRVRAMVGEHARDLPVVVRTSLDVLAADVRHVLRDG